MSPRSHMAFQSLSQVERCANEDSCLGRSKAFAAHQHGLLDDSLSWTMREKSRADLDGRPLGQRWETLRMSTGYWMPNP